MPDLYDFSWVHARAKDLRFGRLVMEFSVKDGRIVMAEEVEAKRMVSLQDSKRIETYEGGK